MFYLLLQMLSLMEHMYHELGLVAEFSINPITLKRWIVSCTLCTEDNLKNDFRGTDVLIKRGRKILKGQSNS